MKHLMKHFWIFTFFLFSHLNAEKLTENALPMADRNGGVSSIVNGCVSAISGNYLIRSLDLQIDGPEPVNFQRSHCSFDKFSNSLQSTWGHNYNSFMLASVILINRNEYYNFFVKDLDGGTAYYNERFKKNGYMTLPFSTLLRKNAGFTNIGKETLHASSNPKNSRLHIRKPGHKNRVIVTTGDGGFKEYFEIGFANEDETIVGLKIDSETKPNGNRVVYHQDKDHPLSVFRFNGFKTVNAAGKLLSEVKFLHQTTNRFDKNPILEVIASNGQKVMYHFFKKQADKKTKYNYFLYKIESSLHPTEDYEYDFQADDKLACKIKAKRGPDGRYLLTEYYNKGVNRFAQNDCTEVQVNNASDARIDRVKLQKAPLGSDATPVISHRYFYNLTQVLEDRRWVTLCGSTDVYDAYANRVSYYYDNDQRLVSTVKFSLNDGSQVYSNELLAWGANGTCEEGCLKSHSLVDGTGKTAYQRIYQYDAHSNVTCDSFVGNLSGCGEYPNESVQRDYTYTQDDFNLLLTETDHLTKTLYSYKPGTNLLTIKFVTTLDGAIVKREFYTYDENAMIIEKIIDDGSTNDVGNYSGVTERFTTKTTRSTEYPIIGAPIQEEVYCYDSSTGQQKLLSKKTTSFTKELRPEFQNIYDSNNALCYTLAWKYDSMGNVEMEQDALGQKTLRKYTNGNLVWEQGPNGTYEKRYSYDLCDRCIKTETIHTDGKQFVNTNRYNYLHQCVATTDIYGNETNFDYDVAGNIVRVTFPQAINALGQAYRPVETYGFNVEGHQTLSVNTAGGATKRKYNARGKVALVEYPDGTTESNRYNCWGSLIESVAKNGTKIVYHYDYQQRILKEEVYDTNNTLLKSSTNTYNTNHLLSSVDPDGIVTTYTYDSAGRELIIKSGDSLISFEYDSLGRKHKTFQQYGDDATQFTVHIKEYDHLNRVIEERTEDPFGEILTRACYAFDADDNQTLVMKFSAEGADVTITEYNDLKLPVKITNGLQQTTLIHYNFDYINPYNQRVQQCITVDPKGSTTITTLDVQGNTALMVKCNAMGEVLGRVEYSYNALGDKIRTCETVTTPQEDNRIVVNSWQYDVGRHLIMQTEAEGAPEQKITRVSYNTYGEKSEIVKSDGVILYHTYNPHGILETFHSSDNTFSYSYLYNASGNPTNIIDHIQNAVTERMYDENGRMAIETLANGLKIQYAYDRLGRPKQIILPDNSEVNYQHDGLFLRQVERKGYIHQYLTYDTSGKLLEEQLCDGTPVRYRRDILGRLKSVNSSKTHTDDYVYDECGNLLGYTKENKPYRFAYDDLYQLKEEDGCESHQYTNDSLYNRVKKDDCHYKLNSLNQVLHDGINQYTYDYNGNLIREEGAQTTDYSYDALDRLISVTKSDEKVTYQYDSFNRRLSKTLIKSGQEITTLFFYQGQDETGAMRNGKIVELRVLGTGKGAEIGASVLIEMGDNTLIPLHDHNGNIIRLLDLQGNIAENYDYTAFGEEKISDALGAPLTAAMIPWRFSSKRHDEETGFQYFGRRYYAPKLGRWITQDPLGFDEGPNLYAYVQNSPLIKFDLYGLSVMHEAITLAKNNVIPPVMHAPSMISDYLITSGAPVTKNEAFRNSYLCNLPVKSQSVGDIFNPDLGVGFSNGMSTTWDYGFGSAKYISDLGGGYKVDFVHNPSRNMICDTTRFTLSSAFLWATPVVDEIHAKWNNFFSMASKHGIYLQYCHSEGVNNVRNALMSYPEELRNRIIVVAIAPSVYIDKKYCSSVMHVESIRDIVPNFDTEGRKRCRDTITTLSPHAEAPLLDHDFRSKTYKDTINRTINEHIHS